MGLQDFMPQTKALGQREKENLYIHKYIYIYIYINIYIHIHGGRLGRTGVIVSNKYTFALQTIFMWQFFSTMFCLHLVRKIQL